MYINKSPKQRKKHIFFAHLQYPELFTFTYVTYLLRFFAYPFVLNSYSKNENQNLHHIKIRKSTVDKAKANTKEVIQFMYDIWMSNLTQN